jgi:hypothetical protein
MTAQPLWSRNAAADSGSEAFSESANPHWRADVLKTSAGPVSIRESQMPFDEELCIWKGSGAYLDVGAKYVFEILADSESVDRLSNSLIR